MKHDNFNGMRDTFMRILRENHIPRNIYSVMGGYSEDAACLEFNGENWEVYYGYRGIKDARQVYGSIEEALEDMVERVSDSYELEAKMKAELQRTWQTASTGSQVRVARLLETVQDPGLRQKVGAWLSGPQHFVERLFSQWSGRMTAASPVMAGTRGLVSHPAAQDMPEVADDGNGVYRFTADRPVSFRFSMDLSPEGVTPLCLVVLSADDSGLSRVYPLSSFGKSSLRVRNIIELPSGSYILCVPSIMERQNGEGLTDA